jgi:3-isopropylmalate/(R)-2-methylmalate dehydratase large subunit
LVAPDASTRAYLEAVGATTGEDQGMNLGGWRSDAGAPLLAHHVFDAAVLVPHVAAPHSPANAGPVDAFDGQDIDTAYIGACTGAKLADLRMAARILRGRRVAAGKRLLVAPASLRDQMTAQSDGTLQVLTDAGAQILPIGCGACAGYGQFRFAEHERVISSTARNFKGRMGADSSRVWLASPYTVAASAVAGRIVDPRILLEETP